MIVGLHIDESLPELSLLADFEKEGKKEFFSSFPLHQLLMVG